MRFPSHVRVEIERLTYWGLSSVYPFEILGLCGGPQSSPSFHYPLPISLLMDTIICPLKID